MESYNWAAIRQLLLDGLADEEITTLCFDCFHPVFSQLSIGMSKGRKIQLLIEYCDRQSCVSELLEAMSVRNPVQYERHQPYLSESASQTA